MRAVTGPLQTGTYIVEAASIPGDEFTLKLNKDQSKLALTKNHQSEAVKWSIQSLGNSVYRVTVIGANVVPIHNLEEQYLSIGSGSTDWVIRETDVPGEYTGSPSAHPSLYVSMERREEHIELTSGAHSAEAMRGRFFLVDE